MEDPLALERQVCFALVTASRSVLALYRPVLEPLGLTHPQYLVMLALWDDSPQRVRDLADALVLESATVTPLLKRLEAQGLVTRTRSAADERSLDVALTNEGRALRERALDVPVEVTRRLGLSIHRLEGLRDELDALAGASRVAVDRLEAIDRPAP